MRPQFALAFVLWMGVPVVLAMLPSNEQATQQAPEQAGDAVRGKLVFERRCTGCHAMDENHEGPQLRTVYGRKAGSVAGFQYSTSLLRSELTWTPETLEQWLTDPDAMVPGNNMSFATPKAADRRDVIAYLQAAGNK
jgi:cytochrome c